ncbi:hypothetical protein ACJX0J_014335, partial [Zea mays]
QGAHLSFCCCILIFSTITSRASAFWLLSSCNLFGGPLIFPPEIAVPLMQCTARKIWTRNFKQITHMEQEKYHSINWEKNSIGYHIYQLHVFMSFCYYYYYYYYLQGNGTMGVNQYDSLTRFDGGAAFCYLLIIIKYIIHKNIISKLKIHGA